MTGREAREALDVWNEVRPVVPGNWDAGHSVYLGKVAAAGDALTADLAAARAREQKLRETGRDFAKWTQHHSRCARVMSAGSCDCGLNDQWLAFDSVAEGAE